MAKTKKVATLPKDDTELAALVSQLSLAHSDQARAMADAEEARIKAVEPFAAKIEASKKTCAEKLRLLKAWCVAHRKERFKGDDKSMEVIGCRFGWRTGNPATDVADGTDWEDVTTMLVSLREHGTGPDASEAERQLGELAASLIREVIEPDRAEMLKRRQDSAVMALLTSIGVTIGAKETFYFTPALEAAPQNLNA
jgi:phage host-nuclease inhibitor protein Gam